MTGTELTQGEACEGEPAHTDWPLGWRAAPSPDAAVRAARRRSAGSYAKTGGTRPRANAGPSAKLGVAMQRAHSMTKSLQMR